MGSKFGLAGGIPERRVRPIWDAVDSRQFKNALKLSTALLSKYPNSPYGLALKALILERMGKPDEALSACLTAKDLLFSDSLSLLDDVTLNTFQIVFQRLGRLDLATSVYEFADAKYLNNLEIMMGLFNCYIRESSYVKQQQTAMRMYKNASEERFLLWAVCSIRLQVLYNNGGDKLLALAEGLLKKHVASHNIHEPEALMVYISILEQQAKFADALEVLAGNLGSLITMEEDKLRMQGRLLAWTSNYAAAAETFEKVLLSCPDDWESFLHYLGCLLEDTTVFQKAGAPMSFCSSCSMESHTNEHHLADDVFDSCLSTASSFIQKLQRHVVDDSIRGPYLADIEIEARRRQARKPESGKFFDSLLNYFKRFGHFSCFYSDVEKYIHMFPKNERALFLEKIHSFSESSSDSPVSQIGRIISIRKIQETLGALDSNSNKELEVAAVEMVELFCKSLPLSRDLDPQESMPGEELLCIASSTLVQLFWQTRKLGYLLEGILVLEFGLHIRRYIWQYKILLVHIYSFVGALPLALEWYGSLDVKNILLESLLHHILPQLLNSPFMREGADVLKDYLKFMNDHLLESADLTCLAFRHRNYSKAIEFVQFKNRLQHSLQYLTGKLDSCILQLKIKANTPEEAEDVLKGVDYGKSLLELVDGDKLQCTTWNQDMDARPWWSPSPHINLLLQPCHDEHADSFSRNQLCRCKSVEKEGNTNRKNAECKALIPRLIYLSIHDIKPTVATFDESGAAAEFKLLLQRYAESLGFTLSDAILVILGISKGQKSFKDYTDVVSWLNFSVFLNAWNLCTGGSIIPPAADGTVISSWHIVDNLVQISITDHLLHTRPALTSPGDSIAVLSQLVSGPFTWHALLIQSCMKSVQPQGKKKKKGSGIREPPSCFPLLQAAHESARCLRTAIQDINNWLTALIDTSEDSTVDALLSHLQETNGCTGQTVRMLEQALADDQFGLQTTKMLGSWNPTTVLRRIVVAHRRMLSEFRQMCESKLKLLDGLKEA